MVMATADSGRKDELIGLLGRPAEGDVLARLVVTATIDARARWVRFVV